MVKVVNSVITREEFIEDMKRLKELYTDIDNLYDKLHDCVGDCDKGFESTFSVFTEAVRQLSERVNDNDPKDWSTISWYIYDNDWGFNEYTIEINGKEFVVNDIETLWEAINYGRE